MNSEQWTISQSLSLLISTRHSSLLPREDAEQLPGHVFGVGANVAGGADTGRATVAATAIVYQFERGRKQLLAQFK